MPLLLVGQTGTETSELRAAEVTVAKPAVESPTAAYKTIAMMPLSSLGSTDQAVDAIQRVLTDEMRKILGDRLVDPDQLLEKKEVAGAAFYSCDGVVVCLIEVIGGLGWDAFVVGNVAGIGMRRVINLKLIDVRTGREVRKTSEKAVGDEGQLIADMRKAAVQLVAPEKYTGTLHLVTQQTGVQIRVDGKLIGTTPLDSSRVEVTAGLHAIEAKGEGLVPFSAMSNIKYGEVKIVNIDLARSTVFVGGDTPFRDRWYTWAIAGAGVLGLGLGAYFNVLHVDTVERIEKRAGDPVTADMQTDQKAHWARAKLFYGVGGGLVAGAGFLLAIDFY